MGRPGSVIVVGVSVLLVSGACLASVRDSNQASPAGATDTDPSPTLSSAQAEPPPAEVPPNRCRVTGSLVAAGPGPEVDALGVALPGRPNVVSGLTFRIDTSSRLPDFDESFCVDGTTIEVLTDHHDLGEWVGRDIVAELELLGSTRERHWWLHQIERAQVPQGGAR